MGLCFIVGNTDHLIILRIVLTGPWSIVMQLHIISWAVLYRVGWIPEFTKPVSRLEFHKGFMSSWSKSLKKIVLLLQLLEKCQVDQVIILHMSRQLSCRDMCKFMTYMDHLNQVKTKKFTQDFSYELIGLLCNGANASLRKRECTELHTVLLLRENEPNITKEIEGPLTSTSLSHYLVNGCNMVLCNTIHVCFICCNGIRMVVLMAWHLLGAMSSAIIMMPR